MAPKGHVLREDDRDRRGHRTLKPFRVLTFTSTYEAMSAEDALRAGDIAFEVVPTPKEVSAGCGLAMRVRAEDLKDALDAVERADIHVSQVVETDRR